jgi:hypothetical protein
VHDALDSTLDSLGDSDGSGGSEGGSEEADGGVVMGYPADAQVRDAEKELM